MYVGGSNSSLPHTYISHYFVNRIPKFITLIPLVSLITYMYTVKYISVILFFFFFFVPCFME